MELTDSQKATVGEWVREGLKLSDIQSRINETFATSMTYMDVRFLLDDLDFELKDQPKPVDSDLRNAPLPPPAEANEDLSPEPQLGDQMADEDGVTVSLHKIYQPGAVVSGEVVFSDGQTSSWALDQIGRLALNPGTQGYQPSESDIQIFQKKLSALLQNQGY